MIKNMAYWKGKHAESESRSPFKFGEKTKNIAGGALKGALSSGGSPGGIAAGVLLGALGGAIKKKQPKKKVENKTTDKTTNKMVDMAGMAAAGGASKEKSK
jgi:hypothetical protein